MNTLMISALVITSCSGPHTSWVPSDIDTDATLAVLGDAAYGKLCSAFADYVRDQYRSDYLVQAACTAHALQTSTDAVTCGEAATDCIDTVPPSVESQITTVLNQAGCPAVGVNRTGCSAKVGELTDCLDALVARLDDIQFGATCAAFGSPVPPDWWRIQLPAQCDQLRATCN